MRDRSASAWADEWHRTALQGFSFVARQGDLDGRTAKACHFFRLLPSRFYLAEHAPSKGNSLSGYFLSGTA